MNSILDPILQSKAILGQEQPGLLRWIFGMKHAQGAGSISQPANLQSSMQPLCHSCPHPLTYESKEEWTLNPTTRDPYAQHESIILLAYIMIFIFAVRLDIPQYLHLVRTTHFSCSLFFQHKNPTNPSLVALQGYRHFSWNHSFWAEKRFCSLSHW